MSRPLRSDSNGSRGQRRLSCEIKNIQHWLDTGSESPGPIHLESGSKALGTVVACGIVTLEHT